MCEHNAWPLHRMQGGALDHLSVRRRIAIGVLGDFHLASLQDEGYAFHQAMGMGGMGGMQRGLYACAGGPYS
nr:unnamed protein product [Callosobruchus chinensis]